MFLRIKVHQAVYKSCTDWTQLIRKSKKLIWVYISNCVNYVSMVMLHWSVWLCSPEQDFLITNSQTAINFSGGIYDPQKTISNDFCDSPIFPLINVCFCIISCLWFMVSRRLFPMFPVTLLTFSSLFSSASPSPHSFQQLSLSTILSAHFTHKFTEFIYYRGNLASQTRSHTTRIPCFTTFNNHKQPQICVAVIFLKKSAQSHNFPSVAQLLRLRSAPPLSLSH